MAKIAVGVIILRQGKASEWTADIDNGFNAWIKSYIPWLQTAKIAVEEMNSLKCVQNSSTSKISMSRPTDQHVMLFRWFCSNHGSFYYNQLAALQILVGDSSGAKATIQKYFAGIYLGQIKANGDQVRLIASCSVCFDVF